MTSESWGLGDFGDERLAKSGVCCAREWWRAGASACGAWRVADAVGRRWGIVGFSRFLANPRVTVAALLDAWGAELSQGCAGRHILAIQDSSELNFSTTRERSRGLGEIGKGSGRGVLRHAMLGVDAETGGILGLATNLATGRIWTRDGRMTVPHRNRPQIAFRCPRRNRSAG